MAMMAIAAEACWCASNLIGFTTNSTRLGTTAAKMTFSANRSTSDSNHPFRAARPMAHTNHAAFYTSRNGYQPFRAVAAGLKFAFASSYPQLPICVYPNGSASSQTWSAILASIAGVTRSVL